MGESLRTAGVVAVASQFNGVASVTAVLAAILTTLGRYAIAGRMGALFILTHKITNPPSVGRFSHPFVSVLR
jgi:putative effector of murein hydrolase